MLLLRGMKAYMRQESGQLSGRRAEHWLGPCCALVFLLVVTHIILMASERHATVMAPQMGASSPMGAIARLLPRDAAHDAAEDGRQPAPHHTMLGDCPAQQTVPPLFLLLLVLMALLRRLLPTTPQATRPAWARPCRFSLPPPLDPARRRALLQVFLN